MKKSSTPWQDKLHKNQPPVIKEGPAKWNERFGGVRMLIANPEIVCEKILTIPRGDVMTIKELRESLAADFDADYTCPLTTGIFLRIAAEAAEEMNVTGTDSEIPWWRVIPDDHILNTRLPGKAILQAKRLTNEGLKINVKDFVTFKVLL
jgi:alkylated DNA nucleotide flippase Atl1